MTKSYSEQVTGMREQLFTQAPEAILKRFDGEAESLTEAGQKALRVGEIAPDFTAVDATGRTFSLGTALADGPVVLAFYRGAWCPYCNLQLATLQSALDEITARGARLVALSPETPDNSLSLAEKHALKFEVLSDPSNRVADEYGLVFTIDPGIRDNYHAVGNDLSHIGWRLPVPATYVIGTDRRIRFAHIDGDYRKRAEAADILKALD
ncbi:peroxiredoxin-like family protein [Nocardia sp. NPDC059240]|uniref:peroxiredoxin-like family protein n=1 Tax=Nocardia sp. NPDC059240 TaxID=3346786 RepID=UPI00369241FE